MRRRLLDLCCGLGGASVGYHRAGLDVEGVDISPQPDYPFTFHQGDAFAFLIANHRNAAAGRRHLDLNPAGRALLDAVGLPYVMENVQGSVLRRDLTLCGEQFGLRVLRHRYFELGGWTTAPLAHRPHRGYVRGWRHGVYRDGPYLAVYGDGGGKATVDECREGLGIDWSHDRAQLVEAIPPAFTEWIGARLLEHLGSSAVAA